MGTTHATNSLEGGTAALGVVVAVALVVMATHSRARLPHVLLAYGLATVLLVGYGLWQGGFPQPSELGWY